MSLRELARRVDRDPAYLSRVERGLQKPSVDVLLQVADVLGLKKFARSIRLMWEER